MSDENSGDDTGFTPSQVARNLKMTPVEIGALAFAVIWVLICIVFFFGLGGAEAGTEKNGVGFVMVVASVLVPIAVVWLAVSAARSARIMTDESDRLQASMSLMRKTLIEVQEFQALSPPHQAAQPQIENNTPPKLESDAPAMFASSRPEAQAQAQPEAPRQTPEPPKPRDPRMRDVNARREPAQTATPVEPQPTKPEPTADSQQPSLKLETSQERVGSVLVEDLIRAINFPENAEDEEGFSALRRALVDRRIATLIQAAQDVLTLLSQDGIYMDDLTPAPTKPDVWRRFAGGARGQAVASLGAVNDRSSLALSAGRMRSDAIFRDAAMHFLRRFDDAAAAFAPQMSDDQINRFATTRTARAFMLIAQVTGTFD